MKSKPVFISIFGALEKSTLRFKYQIKSNAMNSFLALDDMEIGFGGKIALWFFGFLY
jgi:hypothetical protein